MPLSALITFIAMELGGYNIDMVTLLSLSLSVGLIVDAAIVVLESIYHFREKGEPLKQAIVKGTREALPPVFTSQLTIIIVFLPLIFADFEDWLKPVLATIAFTVSSAIAASTIAAFFFKEKITLVPKQDAMARLNVDPRSLLQQLSTMIGEQRECVFPLLFCFSFF